MSSTKMRVGKLTSCAIVVALLFFGIVFIFIDKISQYNEFLKAYTAVFSTYIGAVCLGTSVKNFKASGEKGGK